jgi:uncharacterized protein with HEPN domain
MRPERLYLHDILEAIDDIRLIVGDRSLGDMLSEMAARRAVLHALIVIGEAASKVPEDLRDKYPEVPWQRVVAFRNVVVHEYFALDWAIVWEALSSDLPELRAQVTRIIAAEFGATSP